MSVVLFDDEYHGPRWRYGLTLRGPLFGGVPGGWLVGSWRREDPRFPFGVIDYPRQLSDFEASQCSLVFVERLAGR